MRLVQQLLVMGLVLAISACGGSDSNAPEPAATIESAKSQPAMHCELIMGWDPWEPYQYEIAGGQVFGLDVDLLTAVVRNAGCDISFRKGSWRDLLAQLKSGEIHLLGGATRTADREAFAYFTDPYRDEEFLLYVASSRVAEMGGENLEALLDKGFRVGVIDDYIYGDQIQPLQDNPKYTDQFRYSPMAEINISRLLDGMVDGIIEDKYVGASIIRHKNLGTSIVAHPARFGSTSVRIMVSRAAVSDEQFERLNSSVQELRTSGAIDKVLAQYLTP